MSHLKTHTFVFCSLLLASLSGCTPKSLVNGNKKVVRLALADDVRNLDPAQSNDQLTAEITGHIYEGLLCFQYSEKLSELEPCLAAKMPEVSKDGKTFTFTLRNDAYFQDHPAFANGKGRQVNSEDIRYSYNRLLDPKIGSANSWIFADILQSVETPNPQTVVIKLKKQSPQLLYTLAMPPTSIVAKEVIEKLGPDAIRNPIGTGPYRLKQWVQGSKIVLEKNPTYRKNEFVIDGVKRSIPIIDELQWDIIKEENPRWLKFLAGELDLSTIPKDNFRDVLDVTGELTPEYKQKGITLRKSLTMTSWWIEYNMKDPLLGKNLKLRKALSLAFDRKKALELLFNNRGILASGPLPSNVEGGNLTPPWPYETNLEEAKKLLKEAGFPNGKGLPELSFDLRGPGTTNRQLGELIKDNYSKIGVNLKIIANSFQEALEKQKKSRFQITLGGWAADYPDAENFMQLFISKNLAPGPNSSNFSNSDFDQLYEKMKAAQPSMERSSQIRKMTEILQAEVPVCFFYHQVLYTVAYERLLNYKPHALLQATGMFYDVKN